MDGDIYILMVPMSSFLPCPPLSPEFMSPSFFSSPFSKFVFLIRQWWGQCLPMRETLDETLNLPFKINSCIYFWLCWVFAAVPALSPVMVSGSCSWVAVLRLLIAVASLVVEHSGSGAQAPELRLSRVAPTLCCSEACGIFPHQEANPCLLHWMEDS